MELKPCPFCGGKATGEYRTKYDPPCHYKVYWVGCKKCNVGFHRTVDGYYVATTKEVDYINAWNRRVEV